MKISLNWIKEFVELPSGLSAEKIAHDLTMSTVEVERVIDQAASFDQMVIGKVVELKNHPNADKLKLAMTDIGDGEIKQIVCGGTNLFEGMLVLVAKPGAKVRWHGEGDLVELKEAKIRGEKSFGMICASEEVDLASRFADKSGEIVNLSFTESVSGTNIAEILNLNDIILDIDNKSLTNRPDLWGHYGLAREFAAIYKTKLNSLSVKKIESKIKDKIKVKIKTPVCRRYLSVVVDNIKIGESPEWLKNRLQAIGQKSINNIVDLTNYIMYELGQPTHAFDFDNLTGEQIVVRPANSGEPLVTLDEETQELNEGDAVIADSKKAVALAGVMGGFDSGIDEQTTKIVLEAAAFDPKQVRVLSQKINLRTESSIRFEKGIDSDRPVIAMQRMLELLVKILPEAKLGPIVDIKNKLDEQVIVKVDIDFLNSRLGKSLPADEVIATLTLLDFKVKFKNKIFTIEVPKFRATGDVSLPEDIVEEVARIKGYDNFDFVPPVVELKQMVYQPMMQLERNLKEYLSIGFKMSEVFNYPWAMNDNIDKLGMNNKDSIVISNPPAEDQSILQTSLLPNIIKNVEENINNFKNFGIFEIARTFHKQSAGDYDGDDKQRLPDQPKMLAGAIVGGSKSDLFLDTKGMWEELLKVFSINKLSFTSLPESDALVYDSKYSLALQVDDKIIGKFGFMLSSISNKFDFNNLDVCFFEIDLKEFLRLVDTQILYQHLPHFPEVTRDLSIVVDKQVSWQDIKNEIDFTKLVKEVEFFDCYRGEKIPSDKKSIAFKLILSGNRTLTSDEVDKEIKNILNNLKKKLGGELRNF